MYLPMSGGITCGASGCVDEGGYRTDGGTGTGGRSTSPTSSCGTSTSSTSINTDACHVEHGGEPVCT